MAKTYYNFIGLLQDNYFLSSIKKPTEESKLFWEDLINKGEVDREDFDLACYFIQSVQCPPTVPSSLELSEMWIEIREQNKQSVVKRKRNTRILFLCSGLVACTLILLAIVFFPDHKQEKRIKNLVESAKLNSDSIISNEITLILSDDKIISLPDESPQISYNLKGEIQINSKTLDESKATKAETSAINQLIVPRGKYTVLYLSDGTRLFVNKSTRLVYPVCFNDKVREIFGEGEIFAEVYPDPDRPFIIRTNNLFAKVTGTSLNINAYHGEVEQIMLVHGEVSVKSKNNKEIKLLPSQLYSYSEGGISLESVNVSDYILWKDGIHSYDSGNLGDILKRLSEYYGEKIVFSEEVSKLKCSGKLDIDKSLPKLLEGMKHAVPIDYRFNGEVYKVSIKPKNKDCQ